MASSNSGKAASRIIRRTNLVNLMGPLPYPELGKSPGSY